jgi:hypothetical protein
MKLYHCVAIVLRFYSTLLDKSLYLDKFAFHQMVNPTI